MATEIEHKYLVHDMSFVAMAVEKHEISQGYLSRDTGRTVRVRIIDDHAVITIKGPNSGATRAEFEYPIPIDDARQLLTLCPPPVIVKTRHIVLFHGNRWEVDVFHGDNEGLTVAEIELGAEDEAFERPEWLREEVSTDARYFNCNLAKNPYKNW